MQRISGFGQIPLATTGTSNGTTTGRDKRKSKIRIGTINVSTARDKEEEIVEIMEERKLDILGLCETRFRGVGDRVIHNNYRLLYSGENDGRAGVGIVLSAEMSPCVVRVQHIDNRIIIVDLIIKSIGISIIQVYTPQQGRPMREKEAFYEKLQDVCNTAKYGDRLIICGDMNGHVGCDRAGYEEVIGHHSIGDRNDGGIRIIDFAIANNLSIMNTYYQHQESHKWTWYRYNNEQQQYTSKSMIDLFLTNDRKMFCDVKTIPSLSLDSDHRLLLATLNLAKPKKKVKIIKQRYKLEELKKQDVVEQFREKFRVNLIDESGEGTNKWQSFKKSISVAAEESIGVRKTYGGKKKSTPWWTDRVKQAVRLKMTTFRKWMKTRTIQARTNYVTARNEAERIKKSEKREVWRKIGNDLKEDHAGTKKLLYSMAKNHRNDKKETACSVKDVNNNIITEPEEVMERWREYFEELLNVGEGDRSIQEECFDDVNFEEDYEVITLDEVRAAIHQMKKGKAVGEDGIPVELLDAAGPLAVEALQVLFNEAYTTEKIPEEWQKGVICPIHKKGDNTICGNYRGITLLPHAAKVYSRILEKRVRVCVEETLGD